MKYKIDLSKISLEEYRDMLSKQDLYPSRKILHQNIKENFSTLLSIGIQNIEELKSFLATKKKLEKLSQQTNISIQYLTILNREIGSLVSKPIPLSDFIDMDPKFAETIEAIKFKSTQDIYESLNDLDEIEDFAKKQLVAKDIFYELYCLCGLVRINGVGATAAKIFYDAGYQLVSDVSSANASEMLSRITNVNQRKQYYKGTLGLKDTQFCIDFAQKILKYSK